MAFPRASQALGILLRSGEEYRTVRCYMNLLLLATRQRCLLWQLIYRVWEMDLAPVPPRSSIPGLRINPLSQSIDPPKRPMFLHSHPGA